MTEADADKSGTISKEELVAWWNSWEALLKNFKWLYICLNK